MLHKAKKAPRFRCNPDRIGEILATWISDVILGSDHALFVCLCSKCDRVMRQQEVVSRCPVADCPSGVSRPSAIKAQALAASQEDVAIEA